MTIREDGGGTPAAVVVAPPDETVVLSNPIVLSENVSLDVVAGAATTARFAVMYDTESLR